MPIPRRRYEISDNELERVKDLLPPERTGKPGRPSGDNRNSLNGILWLVRSGAPWSSLYDKFKKWSDLGAFEAIFEFLSIDADMQDLSIDSTSVKVHQHAAGAKKGLQIPKTTNK